MAMLSSSKWTLRLTLPTALSHRLPAGTQQSDDGRCISRCPLCELSRCEFDEGTASQLPNGWPGSNTLPRLKPCVIPAIIVRGDKYQRDVLADTTDGLRKPVESHRPIVAGLCRVSLVLRDRENR